MKNWFLAARPKTLFAGICPVAIGTALAAGDDGLHWPSAAAALCGAMSIQIGTNFCNDYFDFFQGADTEDRKGPTRAVQAGLISPMKMLRATILMFSIAALISIYLAYRAGPVIGVIGALSIFLGVLYTAGRHSLAYLGFGDIFVLVFFGPVAVAGTYFVQTLEFHFKSVIAGLGPGLIAVSLLVVNNLRDINEDRIAGKKTLAVRVGANFVRWEYFACVVGAAIVPIILWVTGSLPWHVTIVCLTLVSGFRIARQLWMVDGEALNPLLGRTAIVLLGYSIVLCVVCVRS